MRDPMNLRQLTIALLLVVCIAAPARDQSPPRPAAELINEVVTNELTDRVLQRKWMYLVDKREGKQTLPEEQVETKDGPLYRVLAIDGTPLDPDQRQHDDARMDRKTRSRPASSKSCRRIRTAIGERDRDKTGHAASWIRISVCTTL